MSAGSCPNARFRDRWASLMNSSSGYGVCQFGRRAAIESARAGALEGAAVQSMCARRISLPGKLFVKVELLEIDWLTPIRDPRSRRGRRWG